MAHYVVKYITINAKVSASGLRVSFTTIEKNQVNFMCNFLRQNVFIGFLGLF